MTPPEWAPADQAALAELQAMLRPAGSADARVEVNAVYRPATTDLEVGGDWYDVLTVTDECMALIVGDVGGHGISAASAMGQLRSALRGLVLAGLQPAAALEALDRFASAVPDAQLPLAWWRSWTPGANASPSRSPGRCPR
jgi:serine phosphatase RsbU (regulator of sigma subunit)